MRFLSLLGGIFDKVADAEPFNKGEWEWLGNIVRFMGNAIIPITIVVLAAGVAWCIYLGIQLARAEDATAATNVKKRLINVAVAFVVALIATWIIVMLMAYVPKFVTANNPVEPATSFLPRL